MFSALPEATIRQEGREEVREVGRCERERKGGREGEGGREGGKKTAVLDLRPKRVDGSLNLTPTRHRALGKSSRFQSWSTPLSNEEIGFIKSTRVFRPCPLGIQDIDVLPTFIPLSMPYQPS